MELRLSVFDGTYQASGYVARKLAWETLALGLVSESSVLKMIGLVLYQLVVLIGRQMGEGGGRGGVSLEQCPLPSASVYGTSDSQKYVLMTASNWRIELIELMIVLYYYFHE